MVPLDEARALVLSAVRPLGVERLHPGRAVGQVVAEAVTAPEPVPPFANTAVDGFAVVAADTAGASDTSPVVLDVTATLAAGADPSGVTVQAGCAVRIMTGAPLPAGADAVVMIERTDATVGVPADKVGIVQSVAAGDNVREAGEDLRPGDEVIAAGTVLSAAHAGVLASIGCVEVAVVRRPRVAVFSTGDELIEGPGPLRPGQIRDSNRHALIPLLREAGCEVLDLGLVPDDEAAIEAAIRVAADQADALLTSGGVSMGDYDHVRAVLDRVGDMHWMQIAIKPAKPFAFGLVGGVPAFGLPGNPVSSLVSFELLARPALRRMQGHPEDALDRLRAVAVAPDGLRRRPDGKTHFVRVVIGYDRAAGAFTARSSGGQGSHQLAAMANANGLAVLPDGDGVEAGGRVEVLVTGEVA